MELQTYPEIQSTFGTQDVTVVFETSNKVILEVITYQDKISKNAIEL